MKKIIICFYVIILNISFMLSSTHAYAQAPTRGSLYVALGSSYASGVGVGKLNATSNGCGRSYDNYPHIIAKKYGLSLVDATCSGATTEDILWRSKNGYPPQISAVNSNAKVVTITIGSNDFNYIYNLRAYSCLGSKFKDCWVPTPDFEVNSLLDKLSEKLLNVFNAVRLRAPNARIVFVSYLPILPPTGNGCSNAPLSANDAKKMRAYYDRFLRIIVDTTTKANIELVRSGTLGAGNSACSSDPYVTGYKPSTQPSWNEPFPYHPNQKGTDFVAGILSVTLEK